MNIQHNFYCVFNDILKYKYFNNLSLEYKPPKNSIVEIRSDGSIWYVFRCIYRCEIVDEFYNYLVHLFSVSREKDDIDYIEHVRHAERG